MEWADQSKLQRAKLHWPIKITLIIDHTYLAMYVNAFYFFFNPFLLWIIFPLPLFNLTLVTASLLLFYLYLIQTTCFSTYILFWRYGNFIYDINITNRTLLSLFLLILTILTNTNNTNNTNINNCIFLLMFFFYI